MNGTQAGGHPRTVALYPPTLHPLSQMEGGHASCTPCYLCQPTQHSALRRRGGGEGVRLLGGHAAAEAARGAAHAHTHSPTCRTWRARAVTAARRIVRARLCSPRGAPNLSHRSGEPPAGTAALAAGARRHRPLQNPKAAASTKGGTEQTRFPVLQIRLGGRRPLRPWALHLTAEAGVRWASRPRSSPMNGRGRCVWPRAVWGGRSCMAARAWALPHAPA